MVKLFVGNLSYQVGSEDLKNFFVENGIELAKEEEMPELNNGQREAVVYVVPDRERRKPSKGFAFVAVADQEQADKAVQEVNGKLLMEREIRIDYAK